MLRSVLLGSLKETFGFLIYFKVNFNRDMRRSLEVNAHVKLEELLFFAVDIPEGANAVLFFLGSSWWSHVLDRQSIRGCVWEFAWVAAQLDFAWCWVFIFVLFIIPAKPKVRKVWENNFLSVLKVKLHTVKSCIFNNLTLLKWIEFHSVWDMINIVVVLAPTDDTDYPEHLVFWEGTSREGGKIVLILP